MVLWPFIQVFNLVNSRGEGIKILNFGLDWVASWPGFSTVNNEKFQFLTLSHASY